MRDPQKSHLRHECYPPSCLEDILPPVTPVTPPPFTDCRACPPQGHLQLTDYHQQLSGRGMRDPPHPSFCGRTAPVKSVSRPGLQGILSVVASVLMKVRSVKRTALGDNWPPQVFVKKKKKSLTLKDLFIYLYILVFKIGFLRSPGCLELAL